MCKCMSTTVRGNGAVQFTFFFIMRLNITIITSCDSLIVILVTYFFFIIKLENGLKKHIRNVARIKHGFGEVVLRLSSIMVGDNETDFSHKLLLTNRQVSNLRKGFASYLSEDIKSSKMIQNQKDSLVDFLVHY